MSFGKRVSQSTTEPARPARPARVAAPALASPVMPRGGRAAARPTLPAAEIEPIAEPADALAARKPGLPKAYLWMGIVGLGFTAIVASNVVGLRRMERQLDAQFNEALGGAAKPIASAASNGVSHGCSAPTVRRVWFGGPVMVDMQLPYTIAQGVGQAAQMGEYVTCLMTSAPERLCDAKERKALVADLRTYAQLRDDMVSIKQGLMRPAVGQMEIVMMQAMRSEFETAKASLTQLESVEEEVMAAAKLRTAEGHLQAADFSDGWFGRAVPEGFKQTIASTPARMTCGMFKKIPSKMN